MEKAKSIFTAQFKGEAFHLVQSSGKSLGQVARDLGIWDQTLHGCKQHMREHGPRSFPRKSGIRRRRKSRCANDGAKTS